MTQIRSKKKERSKVRIRTCGTFLCLIALALTTLCSAQEPFQWNKNIPVKRPGANDNGKLVLFDVSHGGTQGNADWVINGGFSDFADALVREGFTVSEYRGVDHNGDGIFIFEDDRDFADNGRNESIITFDAIKHADVFVMAESNRPLRLDEYAALKQYVDTGKGLLLIGDHYDADRNLNTWDCTEVYNGYNRSDLPKYRMKLPYGDYRNPGKANSGWLATNFGIRFRFNAINCKGASKIVEPSKAEGITRGVGPVKLSAGGTLAILNNELAKGLVYFHETDQVKKWGHAQDRGVYYGGAAEGPVVAISKPSAGKAAFIGDSSPIEDTSGRYRREDNGKRKSLYRGWKGPGSAAVLTVNIVKWLATPESYIGFFESVHPPGIATPDPMASDEMSDPRKGQAWGRPVDGYRSWDPTTFKPGSYGAPRGLSVEDGGGDIPSGPALSVAEALIATRGRMVKVEGVVDGELNGQFGLVLADSNNPTKTLAVKLPAGFRAEFSPLNDPSIKGKILTVIGVRGSYMNLPGIRGVLEILN